MTDDRIADDEYKKRWADLSGLELTMVGQRGKCKHALGETFHFKNPYDKPEGICAALLHVVELYAWRAELGFPSWESDDRSVYRIHCPSKNGTVWELRKSAK